ncbi:NAD-dependent epimerase/dehydratase family protein [Xylanibacter muris]|uniref:NAD(P)-dependent oxidoreductase n=1 Tax=Xylanibacter muris TaxID=2736290 RepID=A0ABX2AL37_9BACT|nr:NAD(P)-dependent oxidoreductase [Xylanibacter muris]NPD90895.1 NAD(P)-dependent oxidoreductase [Xylanibacter muris]
MKVLICGHRSYAARNFVEKLEEAGHEVWCFSRGELKEKGRVITGPVVEMDSNPFLKDKQMDVVVNFILLDGKSIEENIEYIDALCRWCRQVGVKRIVQMSSISVLPNQEVFISEKTPIDIHPELKGGYGMIKIAIDNRLLEWEKTSSIPVVMMRPGFITAKDKKNALAGIAKLLPGGFAVLMGNSKSTLPLIDRDVLQLGLKNAIESDNPLKVYLMVEKGVNTKQAYLKTLVPYATVIPLPKGMVMFFAHILKVIGVFDERKLQMVAGQFKVQYFDTEKTFHKIHG